MIASCCTLLVFMRSIFGVKWYHFYFLAFVYHLFLYFFTNFFLLIMYIPFFSVLMSLSEAFAFTIVPFIE